MCRVFNLSHAVDNKQRINCFIYCSQLQIFHAVLLRPSCGVRQGSVLGPLLFLIYINDLPRASSKLTFYLFADDTNIYYESKNLDLLQRTVNKELKKVKMWLDVNKLSLNIDKTNFIIFKSPQHPLAEPVSIKIGNLPIRKTCYVKFVGVLDENFSWE